jgi:hypothetical protein
MFMFIFCMHVKLILTWLCIRDVKSLYHYRLLLSWKLVMSLRGEHHVWVLILLCVKCFSLGHHINLAMRCIPLGNG